MAGSLANCTINFDSHITKVTIPDGETNITTSGNSLGGSFATFTGTYTVTLEEGYVIDNVTVTNGTLNSKTDNTFTITANDTDDSWNITITSKKSGGTSMIKIKFKDSLTLTSEFSIDINFTSNNKVYTKFYSHKQVFSDATLYSLRYGTSIGSYYEAWFSLAGGWSNDTFKYIEIDPTQTNFQAFITAMKDNILGVELEAGTYKWVDNLGITSPFGTNSSDFSIIFNSDNKYYIFIRFQPNNNNAYFNLEYWGALADNVTPYHGDTQSWNTKVPECQTITTTENQYVDYDFYNYAILGNQLVKQTTPTYSFKHWKKSNVKVNRTLVGQKYYYFKPYTILGLYTITTTLKNCQASPTNVDRIQENSSVTLNFAKITSSYVLPDDVSVTNATYTWDKDTGALTLSNPTGDVSVSITAVEALPQLATPTNVAVTDTTLTFDEVENATSYEVFVDNVSIGTHTNVIEYQITVTNSNTNYKDVENLLIYESDTNSLSTSGATKLGEVSSNQTVVFNVTKKYILVNNIYGYVKSYSGGLTLVNSEYGTTLFEVSNNGTITATGYYCLTGDTLITLANGTQKRIDELTLQDKVLSYNPTTQEIETDEITYTDSTENKIFTEYDVWSFSNGTIIKTVHRHRFYNVERQEMVYMDEWNIGEHAINQNGELIALVSHKNVKEQVKHYTIFTKNQNYFANGLLSGNRYTKPLHLMERDNKGE